MKKDLYKDLELELQSYKQKITAKSRLFRH